MIREIRCPDGNVVATHREINQEAERFFSDFLNQNPPNFRGVEEEELQKLISFRCSLEDCRGLEGEVTEEEIRRVLFAMPSNKSPGPDAFPCEFLKHGQALVLI